ncbi:MAG: molybdate ABC transporter substrate-binding protein [Bacteroidota bacterium]
MRWVALVVVLAGCVPKADDEALIVFAAASMTDVAHRLAETHERETGQPVRVSIGATSTLVRQIEACAPVHVLLAPDDGWVKRLLGEGRLESADHIAEGRLAVIIPTSAEPWESFRRLIEVERLALADPAHVPAGRFAKSALEGAGLWEEVEPRVIPLPHVRAALAAVETGKADAAIVYASDLTVSSRVREATVWPDSLQPDITFACASVGAAPSWTADRFCHHSVDLGTGFARIEAVAVDDSLRGDQRLGPVLSDPCRDSG